MAWRKPNVSSDERPDQVGANINPPHGAQPSVAPPLSGLGAKEGKEIQKP